MSALGPRIIRPIKETPTENAVCRLIDELFKSTNQTMHDGGNFMRISQNFISDNQEILTNLLHISGIQRTRAFLRLESHYYIK